MCKEDNVEGATTDTAEKPMVVLYTAAGTLLYGWIAFFEQEHPGQRQLSKRYRESAPFVICQSLPDPDGEFHRHRTVVFGSIDYLVRDIRRVIDDFVETNRNWWFSRPDDNQTNKRAVDIADFEYNSRVIDFATLIATKTRNLLHTVNRLNARAIPRYDYEKNLDGEFRLLNIFDVLVHNRYLHFDGEYVSDMISERQSPRLDLSFMGYRFRFQEYLDAIVESINDVRVRDVTQFLRWKFGGLSEDSDFPDIVLTVQNLHSFSDIMQKKVASQGYGFMYALMFGRPIRDKVEQVVFKVPRISIKSDLTERKFEIRVRCAMGRRDDVLTEADLRERKVEVDHVEFYDKVNEVFGEDRLLLDCDFPEGILAATRPPK